MMMGKWNTDVGVGVGNTKMGGSRMIPRVGVGIGVGVLVGKMGVGGAATAANVFEIQVADVTEPAIHAKPPSPPANSMYHQSPS